MKDVVVGFVIAAALTLVINAVEQRYPEEENQIMKFAAISVFFVLATLAILISAAK